MTRSVDDNKGIKGAIFKEKRLKLLLLDVSWDYLVWLLPSMLY